MPNPTSLSDFVVSLLRTWVPLAWGAIVTWLTTWGLLTDELATQAQAFAVPLVGIVSALWYMTMRLAETHLPPWLTRLVLGSNKNPVYSPVKITTVTPPSIPRQGQVQ